MSQYQLNIRTGSCQASLEAELNTVALAPYVVHAKWVLYETVPLALQLQLYVPLLNFVIYS